MNSLRIALVVHGWPPQEFGGVGLYVESVAKALKQQGQELTIIAPKRGNFYSIYSENHTWGTLLMVHIPTPKNWKETWKQDSSSLYFLFSHLEFDILHVHHLGFWPLDLPQYITHKKLIVTLHDYALLCGRGQLYNPQKGLCSGPNPSKCVSCQRAHLTHTSSVHNSYHFLDSTLFQRIPISKLIVKRILSKIPARRSHVRLMEERQQMAQQTLDRAHLILAPSQDIIQRTQPYSKKTIQYHPLPLLRLFPYSSLPPLPYQFVFASTIIPTKGLHILLDAIEQLPSTRLIVAGHPGKFESWPEYASEQIKRMKHIPNCTYIGAVEHKSMQELLASSHCLVLPSLWPENSPIIIREALSMGLEVICSAEGGAKELSPQIHIVHNSEELLLMMKHIIDAPRRNAPPDFPTPNEHAKSLLSLYLASRF